MDVLKRIDEIMKKQNLNDYQLSKLSGLSTSTISNMRKRNTIPSIATLEYICGSLDMTLSQFFVEENTNLYPVTDKQKDFLDYFVLLTDRQQDLLLEIVKSMHATYGEKMEQKQAEEENKTSEEAAPASDDALSENVHSEEN